MQALDAFIQRLFFCLRMARIRISNGRLIQIKRKMRKMSSRFYVKKNLTKKLKSSRKVSSEIVEEHKHEQDNWY